MKDIIEVSVVANKGDISAVKSDLLVVGHFSDVKGLDRTCRELDKKLDGAIRRLIELGDFAGKAKSTAHTVQLVAEDYAVRNEGVYSDAGADLQPLLPGGGLLENAFTGAFVEPQFGAAAATAGQVGITVVINPTGVNVGYRVTCFGKTENILTLTNGD